MKKLSQIESEAIAIYENMEMALGGNSNEIVPPITPATVDRVGSALEKLDQIGEMANDLYNTISHLEEIDAETDAALTGAYNSIDDLYTKIDDKYDVIPVELDEYDIEEELELSADIEIIAEKLSADADASEWIDDFVNSDAPQFKGKSKKERIKMALGAYYGAQKNEEVDLEEAAASDTKWRVAFSYADPSGSGVANARIVIKANDSETAKRYAETSLKRKGNYKDFKIKSASKMNEEVELEEALLPSHNWSPGHDMVPAPIGKDTITAKGTTKDIQKLWGIKMRAGKWADTFVGMYKDGTLGIFNNDGEWKYKNVADFEKAFAKFRKTGDLDENVDLEESVNLPKIKELVSLALIDEKDVPATIAALKATQSDKTLTPAQTKLLGNLAVMLTNVILGDTSALSSVKRASKE